MYVLSSKIRRDDPVTKVYSIHIDELKELTGSQPNYGSLRKASKELISRLYTIIDGEKTSQLTALAFFRYEKGSATLELSFSSEIRKYFFELQDQYTLLQFQVASRLASKYSKRIYEMLSQFRSSGWFIISVQELKERLRLIDLETGKDTYPKFGEFSRRALEIAQKEINVDSTDIYFTYIPQVTGRKITHLEFKIRSKEVPKELSALTREASQATQLEERLVGELKISKVLASGVVREFSGDKIERVMKGILKEDQAGKIKKIGAYSKTIFEEWLNGAEPTFEKSESTKKYVPPKTVNQTNQIAALEHELQKKLSYGTRSLRFVV